MPTFARSLLILAAALGCSGQRASQPQSQAEAPAAGAEAKHDAGPPLSEVEARLIMSARFRAAGYRILQDMRVAVGSASATFDGCDPQLRVAFEYVDRSERDTDLVEEERAVFVRTGEWKILIVDATDEAALVAAVEAFLRSTARAK